MLEDGVQAETQKQFCKGTSRVTILTDMRRKWIGLDSDAFETIKLVVFFTKSLKVAIFEAINKVETYGFVRASQAAKKPGH